MIANALIASRILRYFDRNFEEFENKLEISAKLVIL
jgi:hypothetical protein